MRVERPRDVVFAFLDVLSNHVAFTVHMLVDWSFYGPPAGAGARSRMRAKAPGDNWMALEVCESVPPIRTVEETMQAMRRLGEALARSQLRPVTHSSGRAA